MYVSITGLRTRGFGSWVRFWLLAIPALQAAKKADGVRLVSTRIRNGTHHTLTAWSGKDSMMAYRRSNAHRKAMTAFTEIATGRVHGYETDHLPSWDEALALYDQYARRVGACT